MDENILWYELLDQVIGREGLTRPQIEKRSTVSRKTITSWLRGEVSSPRSWRPIVQVLRVVNATKGETNRILQGAGHPPIQRLATRLSDTEKDLLAQWLRSDVPFMPPNRTVATLVGRENELEQAKRLLKHRKLCVLVGMGGVGKTTLAIELAHQLQPNYPDGVFWGDLRTVSADAVLESWGQVCHIPLKRTAQFKSKAATMRTVFSRKQALIVLDDVIDSEQALQMLPTQNMGSTVLITTRSQEVANSLTRRRSELTIAIEPMNRLQSRALLSSIIGNAKVDAESGAANEVANVLGDLPLALHICGALCADAGLSLTQMAMLLDELSTRLDYLTLEEKPLVRLAFEQSWELLDKQTRNAFSALGVFSGRVFDLPAFSAIINLPEPHALLLLTRLCRRSLLTLRKADSIQQYQQHTLLAAFSTDKLDEDDAKWQRFSHYFAELVKQASWWQAAAPELWGNVMAGMETAYRLAEWPLLIDYATHLTAPWRRQGQYSLARQGYAWALEAVRQVSDLQTEADFHLSWGLACLEQSDYQPAEFRLDKALQLFITLDSSQGIGDVHYHLARLAMQQSEYDKARETVQQAYQAYQNDEDVRGMGRSLYRLADIEHAQGEYEQAISLLTDALGIQQTLDDILGLLRSHRLIVQTYIQMEQYDRAHSHCDIMRELLTQADDQAELANFYYVYSDVLRRKKQFEPAKTIAHKALHIFREMADGSSEANVLLMLAGNELNWNSEIPGRKLFAKGLTHCQEGLAISEAISYKLGTAFILSVRGELEGQMGEKNKACTTWVQALVLAQELRNKWLIGRLQKLISQLECNSNQVLLHP